jgi:hypothetical protein
MMKGVFSIPLVLVITVILLLLGAAIILAMLLGFLPGLESWVTRASFGLGDSTTAIG